MKRVRGMLPVALALVLATGGAGAAGSPERPEEETVVVDLRDDEERESGQTRHPDDEIITLDPAVAAAFGFGENRTWKLSELKRRLDLMGLQLLDKDGNPY